jgi:hypothetical protein
MAFEEKLETELLSSFRYLAPFLRYIVTINYHQFEITFWFDCIQFEVEIVGRIDKPCNYWHIRLLISSLQMVSINHNISIINKGVITKSTKDKNWKLEYTDWSLLLRHLFNCQSIEHNFLSLADDKLLMHLTNKPFKVKQIDSI